MWRTRAAIALFGVVVCGVDAQVQKPAPTHPSVILITLDTTRADRMGFLGSARGLTPNLDGVAARAVVFSRAYAQVPLTSPSHATILTGTYPQFHHVNYMGDPLAKDLPYLPEILHKNGYRTAAFVGGLALDPRSIAPGFDRGFDVYDAGFHRKRTNENRYQSLERRAQDVVSRASAWLKKTAPGPFFLWIHLYDAHDPYTPPEPFASRYKDQPYDGEIAYSDAALAKLFSELRTRGLYDGAVIAVMADHGEAFGEHGENHHGIFLYDETIHVPLLIKLPHQKDGRKIEQRVGLVEVAPTLLQAAGLPVPATMQAASLLRFTRSSNKPADSPPVYSESDYAHRSFGWSSLQSWRTGKYLYVDAPERELYEESSDPLAKHNLSADSPAVAASASAALEEFRGKTAGAPAGATRLTSEQSESLHALGYLGSDSSPAKTSSQSDPDPKQRIATANLLYDALVETENGNYVDAIPKLTEVLKQEPNTTMAYLQLGRAYVSTREYEKAIAPLQQVVETNPNNALARYELGCALVKTGRWSDAAPQFEAAVSQLNSSAMMHFYLALVYQQTSRNDEALSEFRSALKHDPNNFSANLMLGRMLVRQQEAAGAIPYLRKAAKSRVDAIDPHRILAEAYTQLGKEAEARGELAEAERIQTSGGSRLGSDPNQR